MVTPAVAADTMATVDAAADACIVGVGACVGQDWVGELADVLLYCSRNGATVLWSGAVRVVGTGLWARDGVRMADCLDMGREKVHWIQRGRDFASSHVYQVVLRFQDNVHDRGSVPRHES